MLLVGGGADEMVAAGAGTVRRGGRQRRVVCVLVKEGQFKGERGIL